MVGRDSQVRVAKVALICSDQRCRVPRVRVTGHQDANGSVRTDAVLPGFPEDAEELTLKHHQVSEGVILALLPDFIDL